MTDPSFSYSYAGEYFIVNSVTNWDTSWNYTGSITIQDSQKVTAGGGTFTYDVLTLNNNLFSMQDASGQQLNNGLSITNVYVSNNLVGISQYAFYGLTNLNKVTYTNASSSTFSSIPNNQSPDYIGYYYNQIGEYSFYGCTSLTSFIFPILTNNIYTYAFYGCTSLNYVQILSSPNIVLFSNSFSGCTSLTNLQILCSSVSMYQNITSGVFTNAPITYLLCTNFTGSYVYSGTLPQTDPTSLITTFYNSSSAPSNWSQITYLTYPDLSYNSPTFYGISNWNIYWDATLSGASTYDGIIDISNNCSGCTTIYSNALNTSSISPQTTISTMNYEQITTIYLPNTVTSIGSSAFSGLTYLTTINLDNADITELNGYTFYGCTSLETISFPSNFTTIGDSDFYGCTSLVLTSLPSTLTSIGQAAFYGCSSLTSITIPATITEINLYTFGNCTSLASLEILGTSVTIDSSSNELVNPFYDISLNYLLSMNSIGTYTYGLTIPTDPTTIIQTFYSGSTSGWLQSGGYSSYPKYVYSDVLGGSGMSFTTSYNSTDASNTYISSTYGNVVINATDASNSIYLGCTDCSSNVNNNLGNTVNNVYVGGNLTVDSSLNISGYATISEDLTVDGSLNLTGTLNSSGPVIITGYTGNNYWNGYGQQSQYSYFKNTSIYDYAIGSYAANNYSIYANFGLIVYNGRILCNGEIDIFSDFRIKQNILDINPNNALDIVRMLKPKTYSYIDTNKNNKKINYGFIAQEVDNVFSDAIMKKQEFIPNIYDIGEVINKNTIKLNNKFTSDFEIKDKKNIKIKLFFINDKEKIVNLKEIVDDKIFTIDENLGDQPVVFIYGQEVEDFHVMEKNAIFTLTTSAVKQLDTELQETKKIINNQQQEINELKKQVNEVIKLISIK